MVSAARDPRSDPPPEEPPHRATVRRILQALLRSDADLNAFCLDYFSNVYARFSHGMDRVGKINVLLEQIETSEVIARLRERYASDQGALAAMDHLLARPKNEEERQTRTQWEALERLYLQREKLREREESTAAIDKEIVAWKRVQRQAAQVGEGDVLQERYRLIELIGRGGFAKVWKAFDRVVKRTVAVKILHGEQNDQPRRVERFERGARQMQALQHPHIVRVLDGPAEDNGFHYFVMDYLPGGDLFHAVSTKKLDRAAALRAVLQVGEALEYAHKRGLVHRDVKPQNILLDEQGAARLTDFDLVWAPDTTGGTSTGFLGTHVYVAPEQAENAKVSDARADIYSLGMTVLFVLHGRSLPQAAVYHRTDFIARLGCSQRAVMLLRHATEIELEKRLDKMGRFRKLLSLALSDILSPPAPPPPDPPAPPPQPITEQPTTESPPAASQRSALPPPSRFGRLRIGVFAAALLLCGPVFYWARNSLPIRRAVAGWIPSAKAPQDEEVELKLDALKEKCNKRQWASVLSGLDELRTRFKTTLLPSQSLAIASLREKALSEQPQQELFEKLATAAARLDDGEVMRLYGLLPSASEYQPMAKGYLDAAVNRYVENNLGVAEISRRDGLCAEARARIEQVLKVVPGNQTAALALAKECDPNVAKIAEPPPAGQSLALEDSDQPTVKPTQKGPSHAKPLSADKPREPPTKQANTDSDGSKKRGDKSDRPSRGSKENHSPNFSSTEKKQQIPASTTPTPEPVKKEKPGELDQLMDSVIAGSDGKPNAATEKRDLPEQLSKETLQRECDNINVGSCEGKGASGTYIIQLAIGRTGNVINFSFVSGGDGKYCIGRVVQNARFSRFSGEPMSLTCEFIIR